MLTDAFILQFTKASTKLFLKVKVPSENTAAVPCQFVAEDDNDHAEFLAFGQHVQYFKTKKRAACLCSRFPRFV